jgi:hypothetical protein
MTPDERRGTTPRSLIRVGVSAADEAVTAVGNRRRLRVDSLVRGEIKLKTRTGSSWVAVSIKSSRHPCSTRAEAAGKFHNSHHWL